MKLSFSRCLRTIAQYDGANEQLCYSKSLPERLKQVRQKWISYKDIQDEAKLLWYMIHRSIKPNRPKVDGNSSSIESSFDRSEISFSSKIVKVLQLNYRGI